MSRLYLKGKSDARKTPITARAHEYLDLDLLWGSKDDPHVLARIKVDWKKDEPLPTIRVIISDAVISSSVKGVYP